MINTLKKLFPSLFILIISCASQSPQSKIIVVSQFDSDVIKQEIRSIAPSVVGIYTDIFYDIHRYSYLMDHRGFVRDPSSYLKYKLNPDAGDGGVTIVHDSQTKTGGGLIIDYDKNRNIYTILTSNHLVSPKDTTFVYYLDEHGNNTDALFAKYVITDVRITTQGKSTFHAVAKVVATDYHNDIAIIQAQTELNLGTEFKNPLGFDLKLDWGDWVYVFGYPKGIKQISGGLVSPAPYPNTLSADVVIRRGYSGGPVFGILKKAENIQLALVGLVKSAPYSTLNYITLSNKLPEGYQLQRKDLNQLIVANEMIIDYGTAYFVSPSAIKKFFRSRQNYLTSIGVFLNDVYFSSKK